MKLTRAQQLEAARNLEPDDCDIAAVGNGRYTRALSEQLRGRATREKAAPMRIREVFGVDRVLLPVVHPISRAAALESIHIAQAVGCPGIFLIDQGMTQGDVLALVNDVRARYPTLWIGVNLLALHPSQALIAALYACGSLAGIWADNGGIDVLASAQPAAEAFLITRRALAWPGLLFGGVAFKYQPAVADADLGRTAQLAARYMDVICTSGPGTGIAADVAKVRALRAGTNAALALASGVTPENVQDYLPYVNAFLVGTGIEISLGVLDARKIEALLRTIASQC